MTQTIIIKGQTSKEAFKAIEVAKESTTTSGSAFGRKFVKTLNSIIIF